MRQEIWDLLKKHSSKWKSWHVMGAISVVFIMATILIEEEQSEKTRIIGSSGPAKAERIFGTTSQVVPLGKSRLLDKTTREIRSQQEGLMATLNSLAAKIGKIESKISEEKSEKSPKTDETSQQPEISTTQPEEKPISSPVTTPLYFPNTKISGPSVISFPVASKRELRSLGITLPPGSYVKGRLMTGIEAPEGRPYPVLIQLDFAYILPNKMQLDLSGCFVIAKAQGDLSTERVQMQATKMSCVAKNGETFEREIKGFIADEKDNSFAVIGTVNSKQDRVAATAFLSSVVEGIGSAIQRRQTTVLKDSEGDSESYISGDEKKFIAAGGASSAASKIADWYLKQAENLLPTINVGSGQELWVVMQDKVDLPEMFFNQFETDGKRSYEQNSIVNNILD